MSEKKEAKLPIGTAVLLVISAIGGYHAFTSFLDHRIEVKLEDPAFLKELGDRLRPSLVFDERGTELLDAGAWDLIGEFEVTKPEGDVDLMVRLVPKSLLANEPLLEPLDGRFTVLATRGPGLEWVFQLKAADGILWAGTDPPDDTKRFRLELQNR